MFSGLNITIDIKKNAFFWNFCLLNVKLHAITRLLQIYLSWIVLLISLVLRKSGAVLGQTNFWSMFSCFFLKQGHICRINQNGHFSVIWPPNEILRALSFLQLLKLKKGKFFYCLYLWPLCVDLEPNQENEKMAIA